MTIKISKSPQIIFSARALLIVAVSFLLYLLVNYVYLRQTAFGEIQKYLKNTNNRAASDLTYKNGQWDTSGYVNDDQTVQDKPLYIITADGFIIDRIKPINGFLDTSDFRFSSSFQSPQTITTSASEQWRLYSKNVTNGNNIMGVILIGYYQPEITAIQDIDHLLTSTADQILSEIRFNGDKIDTSNVDIKKVSVKLSIEVVDKFNHALISVGGTPAYIDRSYVANEAVEKYQTILDTKTGEPFRIYSKPLLDSSNNLIGIVVSANSLKQVNSDLRNELIFLTVSGLAVIIIISLLMVFVFQRQLAYFIKKPQEALTGIPTKTQGNSSTQKVLEVDQKMDGTVVVNFLGKEYKISKPELYSDSDQLIERLMELVQPDAKEVEYDSMKDDKISLATPLSRIVTRLGFVGVKRDLFFPRTSKQRVLFRRYLTQQDLVDMDVTEDKLTSALM